MAEKAYSIENQKNQEQQKETSFDSGSVEYSVITSSDSGFNPVLIVPGFTIGRSVQRDFATELSRTGHRKVVFTEQPYLRKLQSRKPVIDRHAEAILAIIEQEGWAERPVDFIAHSMGAIIFTRAAELAHERGYNSFDSEQGSNVVFVSPAGSNEKESLLFLTRRFGRFTLGERLVASELDPTGEWMRAGARNFIKKPGKTLREINTLRHPERMYRRLGELGIHPLALGYNNDSLMPFSAAETTFMNEELSLRGYAVPVDSSPVPKGATRGISFSSFRKLTGLSKKAAKKAWAHSLLNAGHNDLLFHPKRTANAALQILDRKIVGPDINLPLGKRG
ncbi:MAG: alpha/beta hydrolase [Candidatus Saccharimonadales bacterium]